MCILENWWIYYKGGEFRVVNSLVGSLSSSNLGRTSGQEANSLRRGSISASSESLSLSMNELIGIAFCGCNRYEHGVLSTMSVSFKSLPSLDRSCNGR